MDRRLSNGDQAHRFFRRMALLYLTVEPKVFRKTIEMDARSSRRLFSVSILIPKIRIEQLTGREKGFDYEELKCYILI